MQHVSYALDVSHGRLPTLDTVIRPEIAGMQPQLTYTANHPPLFYVIEAVPLRLGIALGHPLLGFRLARVLNIAIASIGLVVLARLARLIFPGKPGIAVAAPALLAPIPISIAVSGQVFNDALGVTATIAALLCCSAILLRGPTRARLAMLAGAALVVAAARAPGLEVAGLAVVSAAVGYLLHRPAGRSIRRVAAEAAGAAATVAATVLAGIGWFYLRNRQLYGDVTAAHEIVRRFPGPAIPISTSTTSGRFWLDQFKGLFGRSLEISGWLRQTVIAVGLTQAAAFLAGAVRFGAIARRARRNAPAVAVFVLLALHVLACAAILVQYVSIGGLPYSRYVLGATPAVILLVAYGLDWLPPWLATAAVTAICAAVSVVALAILAREAAYRHAALRHLPLLRTLSNALRGDRIPSPNAVLALLIAGVVVGLVGVGAGLHGCRRRLPPTTAMNG